MVVLKQTSKLSVYAAVSEILLHVNNVSPLLSYRAHTYFTIFFVIARRHAMLAERDIV